MNHQVGKGIQSDILSSGIILDIAVNEKDQIVEIFFYNLVKSLLVPLQVAAVATFAVIHRFSSLI